MLPLTYPCANMIAFWTISVSRHRTLMNIFDKAPHVHKEAFVAPSASLIGDIEVGQGASIWYGCALRGLCFVS
jgi:gamma-carbonic anhydrase